MDIGALSILYNNKGHEPAMFTKLYFKKVDKKLVIQTKFHKKVHIKLVKVINPKDYLGTHCKVIASIEIEGIFIGSSNESIQIKLSEVGIHNEFVKSP